MPSLEEFLRAAAQHKPTPEEIASQRRSYVAAEMAMGDDEDERAYRAAVEAADWNRVAKLNAAAEQRRVTALRMMKDMGL